MLWKFLFFWFSLLNYIYWSVYLVFLNSMFGSFARWKCFRKRVLWVVWSLSVGVHLFEIRFVVCMFEVFCFGVVLFEVSSFRSCSFGCILWTNVLHVLELFYFDVYVWHYFLELYVQRFVFFGSSFRKCICWCLFFILCLKFIVRKHLLEYMFVCILCFGSLALEVYCWRFIVWKFIVWKLIFGIIMYWDCFGIISFIIIGSVWELCVGSVVLESSFLFWWFYFMEAFVSALRKLIFAISCSKVLFAGLLLVFIVGSLLFFMFEVFSMFRKYMLAAGWKICLQYVLGKYHLLQYISLEVDLL